MQSGPTFFSSGDLYVRWQPNVGAGNSALVGTECLYPASKVDMAYLRSCWLPVLFLVALFVTNSLAASTAAVQSRIDRSQRLGEPIVVHVVVALCDNENQGIVPVPASLGNGQDPRTNLYWGALYGVQTHLLRSGYELVEDGSPLPDGVLDRIVLTRTFMRSGKPLQVVLVGDAWDGKLIDQAVQQFLEFAAGKDIEAIRVDAGISRSPLQAGGGAAVAVFVGHNGLMDFGLATTPQGAKEGQARGSMILACASKPYFLEPLRRAGSHPLLLTTGLMAPEAYTLDAALKALFEGADSREIHESAAQAYNAYQKCGLRGARRLFYVE